ncbi:MAG: TetR/AcrR family transcriptional regulator [Propioniciclava sp.]
MSDDSVQDGLRMRRADSSDLRVLRTRAKLVEAFRGLLDSAPGEGVTVTAVVRAAGVSRSSFYAHFSDVGDLAGTALTEVNEAIVTLARGEVQQGRSRTQVNRQAGLVMARYLAERKETFGPLLIGGGRFADSLAASLAGQMLETLRTRERLHANPEVTAHYMAGGFVQVIAWWLAADCQLGVEDLADALISIAPADFID